MTELVPAEAALFELDQRRAKAYVESGYWPDVKSIARALVKIEAGRSAGLSAFVAMNEVHVIEGTPSLGAGALAIKVKQSGRYDFRVAALTNERCELVFVDAFTGEVLGRSVFTMEDAEKAKLKGRDTYQKYPRNMLFSRAMSNGVAWFCPDVVEGRVYTPDEVQDFAQAGVEGELVPELPPVDDENIEWPEPDPGPVPATERDRMRIGELLAALTDLEQRAGLDVTDWAAWLEREGRTVSGALLTHERAQYVIRELEKNANNLAELTRP